jgi:uncharacterized protein YbjT (DUF2867 family)
MKGRLVEAPILITGAAGRVGAVGRTVTELLLEQGQAVRAMVRREDERAQSLRGLGAEVIVGDLLDLHSMRRAVAGCDAMYFGHVSVRRLSGRDRQHGGSRKTPRREGVSQPCRK